MSKRGFSKVVVDGAMIYELVCMYLRKGMDSTISGSIYGVADADELNVMSFIPGAAFINVPDYQRHVSQMKDALYRADEIIADCGWCNISTNGSHLRDSFFEQLQGLDSSAIFLLVDLSLLSLGKVEAKAYVLAEEAKRLYERMSSTDHKEVEYEKVNMLRELPCKIVCNPLELNAGRRIQELLYTGFGHTSEQYPADIPLLDEGRYMGGSRSSNKTSLEQSFLTQVVSIKDQQTELAKRISWGFKNADRMQWGDQRTNVMRYVLLSEALRYGARMLQEVAGTV